MKKITQKEGMVITAIEHIFDSYIGEEITANRPICTNWVGESFSFSLSFEMCPLTGHAISGIIGSLVKKGIIKCFHDDGSTIEITIEGVPYFKKRVVQA
jgi:hypothetical protein